MILPSADALPEKLLALLAYDASSPLIFSSGLFLFLFAGFMLLYGAFRRAPMARIVYVILFSLYFYYKSSGIYFLLLVFAAASDFAIARAMARTTRRGARRGLVALSVLVNLSMLGYFKYTNFLIDIANQLFGQGFLAVPEHLPAGRHLVLRLPVDELHHRRLPRPAQAPVQLARLPVLPLVLPAAGGRPDRPRPRLHPADPPESRRRHTRHVRHGRLPDPHGAVQESDRLGLHLAQLRGPHLRRTAALLRLRMPHGHLRLRAADLLRLLGLLGHGHRHRAVHGLPLSEELRRPLQIGHDHRILAAVAHLALDVAARLPVHLARRQPQGSAAHLPEPAPDDAAGRPVARRGGALHPLGAGCTARRSRSTSSGWPPFPERNPPARR